MRRGNEYRNGIVIPLLSEFLEYAKGDTDKEKQDCEPRAFHRLSERLQALFPRLPILLLLDGLYANGPVMQRCHQLNRQFMIVLKDKDLLTVWEKVESPAPLQPDNRLTLLSPFPAYPFHVPASLAMRSLMLRGWIARSSFDPTALPPYTAKLL